MTRPKLQISRAKQKGKIVKWKQHTRVKQEKDKIRGILPLWIEQHCLKLRSAKNVRRTSSKKCQHLF